MARYFKVFLIAFLASSILFPLSTQAWVSKRSVDKVRYKIPFKPKWVSRVRKGAIFKYKRRELSTPVAADGLILVGADSGYFYAFSQKDGDKQWRFKADAHINAAAAAGLGKVFFGDDEGNFYALQLETGDLAWKENYTSPVTDAPLLVGDRLYFVNTAGTVFAVHAETGHSIWSYPYNPPTRDMTMLGTGSPAYNEGRLYIGFSDGHLIAIDAAKGTLIWKRDLSRGQQKFMDVDMQPLVEGDRLYAATFSGHLFCLNRRSGDTLWEVAIGSGVRFSLAEEVLYVAGSDGVVYALNKEDGSQRWKYESGEGGLTRPLFYKDLLVVGSTKHSMLFIDTLNGRKFLQRFARKNIYSDPILAGEAGNLLVYLSNGGRLYALQLKDTFRK